MLDAILRMVTPEELFSAIKSNPTVIQMALFKFDAYRAFSSALTDSQQLCISKNLDKLAPYFNSEDGKDYIAILAEEFEIFCKK
jgi:hypothetical protein